MSKAQELIDELINDIGSEYSPNMGELAQYQDEAVEILIPMLKHDSHYVLQRVYVILGELGNKHVVELMIQMLTTEKTEYIRFRILHTLAKLGDKRAVKPFLEIIREGGREADPAAAFLAKLEDDGSKFESLLTMIHDPTCLGRNHAIHALCFLKNKATVEPLLQMLNQVEPPLQNTIIRALSRHVDPRAVESLLNLLKSSDQLILSTTIDALANIGDLRAFEPILNIAKDKSWNKFNLDRNVKGRAILALAKLGDKRAIPFLLETAQNNKNPLRGIASSALSSFPNEPQVFETFVNLLRDQEVSVRMCTIYALQTLGDKRAIPYLQELYESDDGYDEENSLTMRERISRILESLERS